MEKQLGVIGYWLGLICTMLALICKLLVLLNVLHPSGNGISYMSFLHGAVLFFLLAIASSLRAAKP